MPLRRAAFDKYRKSIDYLTLAISVWATAHSHHFDYFDTVNNQETPSSVVR
jgi:hypothetical protein